MYASRRVPGGFNPGHVPRGALRNTTG